MGSEGTQGPEGSCVDCFVSSVPHFGRTRHPDLLMGLFRPWNHPLILSLQPLIGAIAAGCPAVLKLTELCRHHSALLAELILKYLDPSAYAVVNGGIAETTRLLELRWDHSTFSFTYLVTLCKRTPQSHAVVAVFFTGSSRVGRVVAEAAARHLTPCSLEL